MPSTCSSPRILSCAPLTGTQSRPKKNSHVERIPARWDLGPDPANFSASMVPVSSGSTRPISPVRPTAETCVPRSDSRQDRAVPSIGATAVYVAEPRCGAVRVLLAARQSQGTCSSGAGAGDECSSYRTRVRCEMRGYCACAPIQAPPAARVKAAKAPAKRVVEPLNERERLPSVIFLDNRAAAWLHLNCLHCRRNLDFRCRSARDATRVAFWEAGIIWKPIYQSPEKQGTPGVSLRTRPEGPLRQEVCWVGEGRA